ncbi:MAG: rhamnulose-1-phosphate aldolase [Chloroflexi bacterium]|nr:rhamnulose-1-phosphate aldolase [Chloroflexota bacterium]MCI0773956.1 rhamnulose-1-phosphate aldolase [Chloroflexota bacterium]MCI0807348.1 rhamnulose-1-phosphate aldolase [Chloroflexota bacterium]MCI0827886.1 rhamnulose-1-phosphate aldolase [Chloroflexota bacterium]MCI0852850.1 rhamnulose-1-phosphate aldolase [Chloroflexota bacterium]
MASGRFETNPEVRELMKVSAWLAQKGWSEAGSGNISIRFDRLPPGMEELSTGQPQRLPLVAPKLGGRYLLVTAAGARAREMDTELKSSTGLFNILHGGQDMVCVWGNPQATSELAAHVAIQEKLVEIRPEDRVVLHTHPAHLIALTHIPRLQDSRAISQALLRMQSEAHILFPDGVRYVQYSTPGSVELGARSAEQLERARVLLWHMHGAVATGESLSRALDYLEYIDKMAEIYWILRSAGIHPRGMRDEDIQSSLKHFNLWERHLKSMSVLEKTLNR